jgi:hypothetical protein
VKRRDFITLLGGAAAAAWPRAARAQAADNWFAWRCHFCELEPMDRRLSAAAARARLDRGHTVAIEYRWAEGPTSGTPKSRQSAESDECGRLARANGLVKIGAFAWT